MIIPYFTKHSKVPFINWWLKIYISSFNYPFGYHSVYYDGNIKVLHLKVISFEFMDWDDSNR
jgi:hypothetical protein